MTQKTPKIGEQARAQIASRLPDAIDIALHEYNKFITSSPNDDLSTQYKNHQVACKAALAHIELLVKLSALVCDGGDDASTHQFDHLKQLIENAKQELNDKDKSLS